MADLERAARLDPAQWRFGRMLADRQLRQGAAAAALETARALLRAVPRQLHPRDAAREGAPRERPLPGERGRLARLQVIPYEGSIEGRRLYREAHLMLAVEALRKGDARGAQREIDAARLWPENLGAGKPYPADVDERLEDFLAAQCLERQGGSAPSTELLAEGDGLRGARPWQRPPWCTRWP